MLAQISTTEADRHGLPMRVILQSKRLGEVMPEALYASLATRMLQEAYLLGGHTDFQLLGFPAVMTRSILGILA